MAENEKIKEAVEELTGMSKDEELRILAELREKGRRDEYARRQYAIKQGLQEGRERGMKEGRERGMKEGRERGIKEGREEGIKEGMKQNKIKIAKNMIKRNMKIEDICEITELTVEEIEKLK